MNSKTIFFNYRYAKIRFIFLTFILLIIPFETVTAQKIFDFNDPAGTYIITDYLNHKITLKLRKATSTEYLLTKGPGTITINGKTLLGTWDRVDSDSYIRFETYDNKKMVYNLPSGSTRIDQIVISEDGKASYNLNELLNGDWIKVKKITGASKNKIASSKLQLSDFISNGDIYLDFDSFKNKGFALSKDKNGTFILKKGELTIEYQESVVDNKDGKCVDIHFPDMTDAYNFVKSLKNQKGWKMDKASLGEFFTSTKGNLTVYRAISTVEISNMVQ